MKSYQHHMRDFNNATRHLTRLERSVYRDLIELYYEEEKALPKDIDWVCRKIIARSNEELTAVQQVLNEFFTETQQGYYHERCEAEIDRYKTNSTSKAVAGRASAEARAAKKREFMEKSSTGVEQALDSVETEDQQNPTNHKPQTINHKPLTNNQELNTNDSPQAADKFSGSMIAIFDHWKKIMNHPKAKLDDKRKKLIRAALKLGYSETELITAVDGCAKSPYHMAQDGRNTTVYDDIELILRDAKHIDQFLKINSMPPAPMANQPKFDPLAYVNRGAVQTPDTSVVDFQSGQQVKQLGAA